LSAANLTYADDSRSLDVSLPVDWTANRESFQKYFPFAGNPESGIEPAALDISGCHRMTRE
jgi:hypothetical protein